MNQEKPSVSKADKGFDRVAWLYDYLARAVFGNSIKHAQARFLDQIQPGSRVLLIGGGTGWILDHFPDRDLSIYYVEASPMMLKKAQARKPIALSNEVIFQLGTELSVVGQEPFDVVFTPFFLDLFERVRFTKVFFLLHESLKPGGKWFWVDFVFPEAHAFNRVLLQIMYLFFRVLCGIKADKLPPTDPLFRSLGYVQVAVDQFFNKFISSKVFLKKSD